jgi:hypothetical protein
MDRVRLNVTPALEQPVEDEDSFTHAARNEMREQRDVFVGDMIVPLSEGLRYAKEIEISSSLQASIKRSSP